MFTLVHACHRSPENSIARGCDGTAGDQSGQVRRAAFRLEAALLIHQGGEFGEVFPQLAGGEQEGRVARVSELGLITKERLEDDHPARLDCVPQRGK